MIYVAEIQQGRFRKIGFCSDENPEFRIAQLQTGCPYQITLLFAVEGTLRQEKSIHAALEKAFARNGIPVPPNEWYPGKHQFFVDFLGALKFGANQGIAWAEKYNPAVKQWSKKRGERSLVKRWPN